MQTFHWSRKLLGRTIQYRVEAQEHKEAKLLCVSVNCLQPKLLFDMLSSTPQLIGKQLLNLALDATHAIHSPSLFEHSASYTYTQIQISLYVRFTF